MTCLHDCPQDGQEAKGLPQGGQPPRQRRHVRYLETDVVSMACPQGSGGKRRPRVHGAHDVHLDSFKARARALGVKHDASIPQIECPGQALLGASVAQQQLPQAQLAGVQRLRQCLGLLQQRHV